MRWRDIRFEKPTKDDDLILVKLHDGTERVWYWDLLNDPRLRCWIPTSELPQPDLPDEIPDGWRPVDPAVDAFDSRAQFWFLQKWNQTNNQGWDGGLYYIVPIDPPKPKYRPFASREEWWPHRDRWVRNIGKVSQSLWASYEAAEEAFNAGVCFLNDDGTDAEPFGVLVSPAEAPK